MSEYVVAPGSDLGDYYSSSGRELIHVVAGRLVVDLDDGGEIVSHELGAGDSLVYPTSVRHRWRHAGRATTAVRARHRRTVVTAHQASCSGATRRSTMRSMIATTP